jgi:sortase (surface protein transpeptidase)
MMKHEDKSWVTLVTCQGYDEATDAYKYRILVRAVLVEVK